MSCYKCDLSIGRKNVVLGDGNKHSDIMIVGEAPGYHEDKIGTPFIGNSGKYLRELLKKIDLNSSNTFITNVVKCRPPKNRTPSNNEISICTRFFLANEIKVVDPVFIIAAGQVATTITTGQQMFMKDAVDKVFKVGRRWVLPIYHPSYILQNTNLADNYIKSILTVRDNIEDIKDRFLFDIIANFNNKI